VIVVHPLLYVLCSLALSGAVGVLAWAATMPAGDGRR